MEIPSGTILKDRYIIKEQLGRGGMGAVYLAEDTALDQLVAVKANLNPGAQAKRQFETEARLLAKLRHPNLPLVFDHFIIDDVQYLVMDFIPGEDLNSRIREEGPQAVYKVLEWAEQISNALNYLHSQEPPVIHRDIKPANIKITPKGQIVLVDFGIAKASEGDTTLGARGYSPGYAPPEQYSQASTGHYSDQYSFAATLYALLTGSPPPESVDLMLGQKTLPSTRSYSRNVPLHVDTAIRRAMSMEPAKRYANIKEFMTALTDPAALAEETQRKPILEGPTEIRDEPPTQVAAPTQAPAPTMPEKANRTPLYIALGAVLIVILGVVGFLAFGASNIPVANAPTEEPAATDEALQPTETQEILEDTAEPSPPPPEETDTPEPSTTPTLTPMPTETLIPSPEATPLGSGGRIAFVSNRDGNQYEQIFLMDPDGGNITQLTFDEVHKRTPMWSPDGSKIVYVADGGPNQFGEDFALDIWTMDADGQNQNNISKYPGNDSDPIWTPDGEKIIYVTQRFGNVRLLVMVNPDGSGLQRLSLEFEEYNPTFSPDGEQLMVTGTFFYTLSVRPNGGLDDPVLYDVRWSESDRVGRALEPAWSPDGEWIVYIRTNDNNRLIYILEAESRGATLRRLDVPGANYDPAWSPDSNWIVFTNSQQGNQEIYIMDKGGRFLTNLTNDPAVDKMPSWKPVP